MDLIFEESLRLDEITPRLIRGRIDSFRPLLRTATDAVKSVCSEIATAFVHYGNAERCTFRLFVGEDRFRVEMMDTMLSEGNLTAPEDQLAALRLSILEAATDRWGVLGDGVSIVWFEVLKSEAEERREADR